MDLIDFEENDSNNSKITKEKTKTNLSLLDLSESADDDIFGLARLEKNPSKLDLKENNSIKEETEISKSSNYDKVLELMSLGFDELECERALEDSVGNDFSAAKEILERKSTSINNKSFATMDIFAKLKSQKTTLESYTSKLTNKFSSMLNSHLTQKSTEKLDVKESTAPKELYSQSKIDKSIIIDLERAKELSTKGEYEFSEKIYVNLLKKTRKALPKLIIVHELILSFKKQEKYSKIIELEKMVVDLFDTNSAQTTIVKGKNMAIDDNLLLLNMQFDSKEDYDSIVVHKYVQICLEIADSYEKIEKFDQAKNLYQEIKTRQNTNYELQAKLGDAIKRCRKYQNTIKNNKPESITIKTSKIRKHMKIEGKALKNYKELERMNKEKEDFKTEIEDKINEKINKWKQNKERNLIALLSSLHKITWQELNFKQIEFSILMDKKKLKFEYYRIITKFHPDKISLQTDSLENQLLAQNIFVVLNGAYQVYQEENS